MNDNRNYKFGEKSESKRPEYPYILKSLKGVKSVIDLGCGDGSLMLLMKNEGIEKVKGIEISKSGVTACRKKGLDASEGRIDVKLPFEDNEFDVAVCNVTLQMVMYPEVLISEMLRISKKQIFTFPNFAFAANRVDILLNGRMPRFMIPGYKWYSTGHIHQLSINDFCDYCRENKIDIIRTDHIFPEVFRIKFLTIPQMIIRRCPNLFASTGVFITKNGK